MFILIVGKLPFPAFEEKVLFAQISSGIYKVEYDFIFTLDKRASIHDPFFTATKQYPTDKHEKISADAKDIIKRMLTKNPKQRLTAADALKHRWISQRDVAPRMHLGETIVRLKKFNARRKFKVSARKSHRRFVLIKRSSFIDKRF